MILPKDRLSGTLLVRRTAFKDYLMIGSTLLNYLAVNKRPLPVVVLYRLAD